MRLTHYNETEDDGEHFAAKRQREEQLVAADRVQSESSKRGRTAAALTSSGRPLLSLKGREEGGPSSLMYV